MNKSPLSIILKADEGLLHSRYDEKYLNEIEKRGICFDRIYLRFPSCQNATALAAATFRESTPWDIGMRTV